QLREIYRFLLHEVVAPLLQRLLRQLAGCARRLYDLQEQNALIFVRQERRRHSRKQYSQANDEGEIGQEVPPRPHRDMSDALLVASIQACETAIEQAEGAALAF